MSKLVISRPNPRAEIEEQKRFEVKSQGREPVAALINPFVPLLRFIPHLHALFELYVALAGTFPVVRSAILLSILMPTGTVLGIASTVFRLACYRHLGRYFTFELSIREEHKLITDGPYSFIRHPSYLAIITFYVGDFLCLFGRGSWWSEGAVWETMFGKVLGICWLGWITFLLVAIFGRMPMEDKVLRDEFGKQWVEWSKRTPYRLIPGIY